MTAFRILRDCSPWQMNSWKEKPTQHYLITQMFSSWAMTSASSIRTKFNQSVQQLPKNLELDLPINLRFRLTPSLNQSESGYFRWSHVNVTRSATKSCDLDPLHPSFEEMSPKYSSCCYEHQKQNSSFEVGVMPYSLKVSTVRTVLKKLV